jgi:hypothetical protein
MGALRVRQSGAGPKPPQAAAVKTANNGHSRCTSCVPVSVDLANMTRPATGFQLGDITPQFPMCGFSGQVVQILDHLGVRRHLQTFK